MANRNIRQETELHPTSSPSSGPVPAGSISDCNLNRHDKGGNDSPDTPYYSYDNDGNILLGSSFKAADEWWGMRFGRYIDQPVIVGRTEKMRENFDKVMKVAPFQDPVLIQAPPGTEDELFARALAKEKKGLLRIVNCAALTETQLESQLFGCANGTFTGATSDGRGEFEIAHKGTLFLKEIQDMPLRTQTKLQRVVADRTVVPIGSTAPIDVDVRLICAISEDPKSLVAKGKLRRALYCSMTLEIDLPPLSKRKEDIPLLTAYFVLKHRSKYRRLVSKISSETLEELCAYEWPGNVLELEGVIRRGLLQGEGPILRAEELSLRPPSGTVYKPQPKQTDRKPPDGLGQKRVERILELLRQKPYRSSKELATTLCRHIRSVQRDLHKLVQTKVIAYRKEEPDKKTPKYYLSRGARSVD